MPQIGQDAARGNLPCRWVVEQLPLYLDDELDQEAARRVSRHVAACASCRDELGRETTLLEETIQHLVPQNAAPDSVRRLDAALPSGWRAFWERSGVDGYHAAAALLLLGVCVFLVTLPDASVPKESSPGSRTAPPAATGIVADADEAADADAGFTRTPVGMLYWIRKGDLTGDGELSNEDLAHYAEILDQRTAAPTRERSPCPAAGDYDEDGAITPADSLAAAQELARNPQPDPQAPPDRYLEYASPDDLSCVIACP